MKTKGKQMLCGVVGTLAMCFMLTGCGHEHTWAEATCTTPKTCNECGETEGEALGHTWAEATCATPQTCTVCGETEGETLAHTWVEATCAEAKHCNVCGETEGEPLAHTLTEANYQQAAACEVCGETVGEPLQAYFEKNNQSCNAELNKTYMSLLPCLESEYFKTTAKATFSDYETFASDETHEALEGYEWKTITLTFVVDDEYDQNGYLFGFCPILCVEDYYSAPGITNEWNINGDNDKNVTVNYNGVDYSECLRDIEEKTDGWIGMTCTVKYILTLRLPEGYDGAVVGICSDATKTDNNGEPIYDTYFRLQ